MGGVAIIKVSGILVDSVDRFAAFFGETQTRYGDIISAINEANADPKVSSIQMMASGPGGQATAQWLETMKAVADSPKPITAYVDRMAASATYGIVSQAQRIVALNEMSQFGSIGVVTEIRKRGDSSYVTITSDDAPNKVPDPETEEGVAAVKKKLNDIHAIFADRVTTGRKTTAENVKNNYGKGAMFLAKEALSLGMIDSIGIQKTKTKKKGTAMTLEELKASEPTLFAQIVALGVNQERDRVTTHMELGEAAGAVDVAVAMIKSGAEHTGTTNAKYMAAGLKQKVAGQQAAASDASDAALDGAAKVPKATQDELLAAKLENDGEDWNG
jgi:ClpP class serine protease